MKILSRLLLPLTACCAFSAPDFSQVGFSTRDGGTTGGAGGSVVRPADLRELKRFAEDPATPYVILIDKEMNTGVAVQVNEEGATGGSIASTYGDLIYLGSNKSLIGIGDKAFFNRVGLVIQKKKNIIIRNVRFTMKYVPVSKADENKVVGWKDGEAVILDDPDCISIKADSGVSAYEDKKKQEAKNIWIDHCEFYNEDPEAMDIKDRYDGLLDAKNNVYNITVSWNYFHDHHKGSLIGNSDSDDFQHRFTFHHNHFRNITSRQPLIRFGYAHLYNNYIHDGGGNGIDVRIDSDLLIEKNQFAILSKAVFGSDGGKAQLVDNVAVGNSSKKTTLQALESGSFAPPYSYQADPVDQVISLVTANAGIGKISTGEYETSALKARFAVGGSGSAWASQGKIHIHAESGLPVEVADLSGSLRYRGETSPGQTGLPITLESGIYFLNLGRQTIPLRVP